MSKEQYLREKIIQDIRRKLTNAYLERDDYPPFALTGFEDRPRYSTFVRKVLDEIEKET